LTHLYVPATFTHLLARRGGRIGRSLAPVLDLAAATGVRNLLTRRREEMEYASRSPKYRVNLRIWSEAARACGGSVQELGAGFLEIVAGAASARVWMQVTPLDNEVALRLALDKTATQSLLSAKGLPVPEHISFDLADPSSALRLVEGGGTWVVKPADGTGSGQGTTTGIRTEAEFLRASARASRGSTRQLLERQVPGEEYRLLLLDGELLGAVRRSPPSVVGDGVSTVAGLVHAENRRRLDALGDAGVMLITLDLDALLTLARDGTGPRTVPPAGSEVRVKTARNQAGSRDSETIERGVFAEELVDEARRAAAAVDMRLAGVDLITSDPGRSLAASGGAIIEVNGTPGLHYHYLVRNPAAATPVAVPILMKMLETQSD
jgi:cyanophycin synthetase